MFKFSPGGVLKVDCTYQNLCIMSQNNDISANQGGEALQAPAYHDFGQSSIQHTNEHNQIQQSYVQVSSNQHVLDQSDIYSAPSIQHTNEHNQIQQSYVEVPSNQQALNQPGMYYAPSFQQINEHNQVQQSYVQVLSNQHVMNQAGMCSIPSPMPNSFAEPSFIMGQNLPPQTSYMQGRMPESSRGSSSRSGGEVIPNEPMENHQDPNAPPNIEPARNPQIIPNYNNLYDSRYVENDLPVDPFLRFLKQNPNFDDTGGNN